MDFSVLTEFLNSMKEQRGLAGFDCMVRVRGQEVYRHMQGYADAEAARPIARDTIYRMFSMTKPITCTAALQLYEKGKFLMTDPLSMYLPEFEHMMVRTLEGRTEVLRPAKNPIRVRDLFTMSAGLSYNLGSPALAAMMEKTQMRYTTRDLVRALAQEPLMYDPGEHWLYSLAHDVLGALIEELSGMPFDEYLQKNIFDPLGMRDAHFIVPQDKLCRCAYRYTCKPSEAPVREAYENIYQRSENYRSGGAGLSCTLDDYARFADALCNQGYSEACKVRILGSDTVRLMTTNHLNEQQMADFNWVQYAGYGYGLGVRTLIAPEKGGCTCGMGEFGWGGAAGTYVIIDPSHELVMIFGQQSSPPGEDYIQPRIRNIVIRALEG